MNTLVTVAELAVILGVPKSWIYERTRQGQEAIPHIKLGQYVRFDAEEVLNFFKSQGDRSRTGARHTRTHSLGSGEQVRAEGELTSQTTNSRPKQRQICPLDQTAL